MDAADKKAMERLKTEIEKADVSSLAREAAFRAVDLAAAAANGAESDSERVRLLADAVHAGNVLGSRTLLEVAKIRGDAMPNALWERILSRVKPIAWPAAFLGATGQVPSIIEAIKNLLAK